MQSRRRRAWIVGILVLLAGAAFWSARPPIIDPDRLSATLALRVGSHTNPAVQLSLFSGLSSGLAEKEPGRDTVPQYTELMAQRRVSCRFWKKNALDSPLSGIEGARKPCA